MIITPDIQNLILPQYPYHLIYPDGKVYSLKRKKFCKARLDKYGYRRFTIKNVITQKKDTCLIHHLVGKKYLNYNSSTGLIIDHIDNNKENNDITNLQIMSSIQNTLKSLYYKINISGLPSCLKYTKKNGYTFKLKNYETKSFTTLDSCLQYREFIFKQIFENHLL